MGSRLRVMTVRIGDSILGFLHILRTILKSAGSQFDSKCIFRKVILGFLWPAFGTWASVHVPAAWFLCRAFTILEQDEIGLREFRLCA